MSHGQPSTDKQAFVGGKGEEQRERAEADFVSALFELENIVIVVYNDNTRNKNGGLYGDKN